MKIWRVFIYTKMNDWEMKTGRAALQIRFYSG